MQHAAVMIYLQTAGFAIATILNIMLAYETSPRAWTQAINIAIFAALTCYQIYQWPIWNWRIRPTSDEAAWASTKWADLDTSPAARDRGDSENAHQHPTLTPTRVPLATEWAGCARSTQTGLGALIREPASATAPACHGSSATSHLALNERQSAPSKSEKCGIAEIRLRLRARLRPGRSAGHRPPLEASQRAFWTCKEAMRNIWRRPVLKRKMAIPSRQRITTSTPNIIFDRCPPKGHSRRRLTKNAFG
jgi:hypothetical protein